MCPKEEEGADVVATQKNRLACHRAITKQPIMVLRSMSFQLTSPQCFHVAISEYKYPAQTT